MRVKIKLKEKQKHRYKVGDICKVAKGGNHIFLEGDMVEILVADSFDKELMYLVEDITNNTIQYIKEGDLL